MPFPAIPPPRRFSWRKAALRAAAAGIGLLVLAAGLVALHARLFPFSIETRIRDFIMTRLMFRPVVNDRWGALLTRVLPLDDRHVVVGRATALLTLRWEGDRLVQCGVLEGHGIVHGLAYRAPTLYVAHGFENLAWYDATDPCALRPRGHFSFGGYGFGLEIWDDRVFVANRSGGMVRFRLDPEGRPRFDAWRYGSNIANADKVTPWMTNDVTRSDRWLIAADGNRGVLVVEPDGPTDAGVRAFFQEALTRPRETRDIDPAPLRVQGRGEYLYVAMREQGVAILRRGEGGVLELAGWARPDAGQVLDLAVAGDSLYVPSTSGRIYAYDAARTPLLTDPPDAVYDTGERRSIHSIAVRAPYLYASAVGAGLFAFRLGGQEPPVHWRPPDEYRDIEWIGDRLVAALGSGGVAVLVPSGGRLEATARIPMPSFVFDIEPLDGGRFAVSADLAGTHVFEAADDGSIRHVLEVPTPEHVFAATFVPPDHLATANGVYGMLRYRLTLGDGPPRFESLETQRLAGGYSMDVDTWRGGAVAGNIGGRAMAVGVQDLKDDDPILPSRCLAGSRSPDGQWLAMACRADRVAVLTPGANDRVTRLDLRHPTQVASVLPDPPFLLVGGFPTGLTVYRVQGERAEPVAELETDGTPYGIVKRDGRYWIAGGTDGIYMLSPRGETWHLARVAVHDRATGVTSEPTRR